MRTSVEIGSLGWALWPALGLAAAFTWHSWRSRSARVLLILRALAVFAAVMAMLNPALVSWGFSSRRPRLLILLDNSDSMGQKENGRTRLSDAAAWLLKHREAIDLRVDAVFAAVSDRPRLLSDWGELKSLASSNAALAPRPAIGQAMADWPEGDAPERAWLLSDGNAEPPGDLVPAVKSLGFPVDAIGIGSASRGSSADLLDVRAPDFAFTHESVLVRATVEASELAGKKLELRLVNRETGGILTSQALPVDLDYETATATFTIANVPIGIQKYRLEARAQGGTLLSSRDFELPVLREKDRVLYLTGRPSSDYVFLRRFLKSDPNRELVSFVILRDPDNPAAAPDAELSLIPFPAYEIFVSDIRQFDVFILENFSFSRFNLPPAYLDSIKDFVAAGGSLLVIGGDEAFTGGGLKGTVLEDLLPVELSRDSSDFKNSAFSPAPAAASHPLVQLFDSPEESLKAWNAMPPLEGHAVFESVRPEATVLAAVEGQETASGSSQPFMALRSYGRGRVLLVNSNSTWRWKLGSAADPRLNSFYDRFWSKALSYLVGNLDVPRVKFSPVPGRLQASEPAVFTLKVFDQDFRPAKPEETEVSVLWKGPKGAVLETPAELVEPGTYSVSLTGISAGINRLQALAKLGGRPWGEASLVFNWKAAQPPRPMAWRRLREAAEESQGRFVRLKDADAPTLLSSLRPVASQEVERRRVYPVSSAWWLWLCVTLLVGEWGLRRWMGYV